MPLNVPISQPLRWAWLAGLIEGDGCITNARGEPRLVVSMTDEDVVRRAQEWAAVGTVNGPYIPKNGMNVKPLWVWTVNGRNNLRVVLQRVLPYLGERRGARAREALALIGTESRANVDKLRCNHGHKFTSKNTYIDPAGKRHCRECKNRAWREMYHRRKVS